MDLKLNSVSARLGVLLRADGSCQWNQGDNSAIVAVWGPMAPKRSINTLSDRSFVEIRILNDINENSNENLNLVDHENLLVLKQHLLVIFKSIILEKLHPRCQISIIIQILSDNGNVLFSF